MKTTVNVLSVTDVDDCSDTDEEESDDEVAPIKAPVIVSVYNMQLVRKTDNVWRCTEVGKASLAVWRSPREDQTMGGPLNQRKLIFKMLEEI